MKLFNQVFANLPLGPSAIFRIKLKMRKVAKKSQGLKITTPKANPNTSSASPYNSSSQMPYAKSR